ncbi:MAG: hypothetical protein FD163_1075 [Hyphomonadaceae bacterium]|nr:MAG: hypothetical protein FD128_2191 [Hyphomonadaceae bacterium]KAF0186407.1 MAG: hypothetical protein FD163_1075 [Hyphomonadaceae bacterium]
MYLIIAGVLIVFTAGLHSIFGEKRLITPLLASDLELVKHEVRRPVIRFAWHMTSLLWLILAYFLVKTGASGINGNADLVVMIGILHIGAGLYDGVVTKWKHVGWAPITLIGVFCMLGVYFN